MGTPVAAIDLAGNKSEFASPQAFSVDATAPGAPTLVAVSPDPTSFTLPTFAFAPTRIAARSAPASSRNGMPMEPGA